MPENLTFKNNQTGEVLVMPWSGSKPPTKKDIEKFKKRRDAELTVPPPVAEPTIQAFGYDTGIKNPLPGVSSFLYDPLDYFPRVKSALSVPQKMIGEPTVKSPEEVKKLPMFGRIATLTDEQKKGEKLSDEDIRDLMRRTLNQESRVGRKGQQVLHDVTSPENVALTAATAGSGTLPKLAAKAVQVGVPAYFAAQMGKEVPGAVDRAVKDPSFENISDVALTAGGTVLAAAGAASGLKGTPAKALPKVEAPKMLAGERVKLRPRRLTESTEPPIVDYTNPYVSKVEDVPPEVKALPTPPKQLAEEATPEVKMLPERGEKPIRGEGFTMSAPREIVPTVERPVELDTSFRPASRTTELAYGGGEGSRLVEKPTGFVARQPALIETPEVKVPKTVDDVLAQRKLEAPMVEGLDRTIAEQEQPKIETKPKVKAPKTEAPIKDPLAGNEWMRNQETEALVLMRKGESGEMAAALDAALAERGIQPPKPVTEPPTVGMGEGASSAMQEKYNQSLSALELTEHTSEALKLIAGRAKAAGISRAQVIEDMMKAGVNPRNAAIAAARIYRPGEAGFFNLFAKGKPKLPNSQTPQGAKLDAQNIKEFLSNWFVPNPEAIQVHSGDAPIGQAAASELTRLAKLQRTASNALAGSYKAELAKYGIGSDRTTRLGNLGDEEFNTIPGNVVDVITKNHMAASPEIKAAADALNRVDAKLMQRAAAQGMKKRTLADILRKTRDREAVFNHITDVTSDVIPREIIGKELSNSPKVLSLLDDIKRAGGNADHAKVLFQEAISKGSANPFGDMNKPVNQLLANAMTATYLPFFAISDVANLGSLAYRANMRKIIPAAISNLTLKNRMNPANISSGAMNKFIVDSLAPEGVLSKAFGMRKMEQYLRSTAAEAGRGTAVDLLEGMKGKNVNSYTYKVRYNRLKNLTLKNDAQMLNLIQRGKLTNAELDVAGGRMAEMTQGLVDNVDLPYEWTHPGASQITNYVLTYKRFAYNGAKNLVDAFKENPLRAGLVTATIAPVVGEVVGDTKAMLKGAIASVFTDESAVDAMWREYESRSDYLKRTHPMFKEHPALARYLTDVIDSWALGFIGDMALAAETGTTEFAKWFAGPQIALIGEVVVSLTSLVGDLYRGLRDGERDKMEQALKNIKNLVPGRMGSAVARSADEPPSQ